MEGSRLPGARPEAGARRSQRNVLSARPVAGTATARCGSLRASMQEVDRWVRLASARHRERTPRGADKMNILEKTMSHPADGANTAVRLAAAKQRDATGADRTHVPAWRRLRTLQLAVFAIALR